MRHGPPIIPPPILALGLLLIFGCLTAVIPLSPIPIPAGRGIGVSMLILGFVVGYSGFSAFRKAGTPVRPGDEPTKLVTSGPCRISRNPMYLGLELVLLGVFFLTKSPFFLIPQIVFFLLINFLQIPFEENLMTERFGQSYAEYCSVCADGCSRCYLVHGFISSQVTLDHFVMVRIHARQPIDIERLRSII
jgi:protein-S-isoprenylcysteine O-methyltransferase Ste14